MDKKIVRNLIDSENLVGGELPSKVSIRFNEKEFGFITPKVTRKGRKMLVLSRKKNESIVINNDITIVVVEIRGDKVRLGVEAPREVPVHRREVFDAIQRSHTEHDADTDTSSVEE